MKVLIVAATAKEIKPTLDKLGMNLGESVGLFTPPGEESNFDFLITGVGQAQTAWHLGKYMKKEDYDLVVNVGIAGSYTDVLKLGMLINVRQHHFADLGAEDGGKFMDLFDLKLANPDKFPFNNGMLMNESSVNNRVINSLPMLRSISVNKATGNQESIDNIKSKYNPHIESMEGAAFFYACLMEKINFFEIRCISNYVEVRNKDAWDLKLAIDNLNTFVGEFMETVDANALAH